MEALIQKLLIENYNRYYRLAYCYVQNEQDAMDIVQEGAYKAILNSASLQNKEYAGTWIYRIMVNEALGVLRKQKKEQPTPDEVFSQISSAPDAYEDTDLRDAINGLEPQDKIIITLRYFEDLKIDQIANIMEENSSTIKSRLYRSLKKLKLSLAE